MRRIRVFPRLRHRDAKDSGAVSKPALPADSTRPTTQGESNQATQSSGFKTFHEAKGEGAEKPATTANAALPDFISHVPVYRGRQLDAFLPDFNSGDVVLDFLYDVPDGFPIKPPRRPVARLSFRLGATSSECQLQRDREAFKKELRRLYGGRHRQVNNLLYAYVFHPADNDVSGACFHVAIIVETTHKVHAGLIEADRRLIFSWFSFAAPALVELHEHRVKRQRIKPCGTSQPKKRLSAYVTSVGRNVAASGTADEILDKEIGCGDDGAIKRARIFTGLCFLGHLLLFTPIAPNASLMNRIPARVFFRNSSGRVSMGGVGTFLRSGQLSWENIVWIKFGRNQDRRSLYGQVKPASAWADAKTDPFQGLLFLCQKVLKGDSHILFASVELLGRFSQQLAPALLSYELPGEILDNIPAFSEVDLGFNTSEGYYHYTLDLPEFDWEFDSGEESHNNMLSRSLAKLAYSSMPDLTPEDCVDTFLQAESWSKDGKAPTLKNNVEGESESTDSELLASTCTGGLQSDAGSSLDRPRFQSLGDVDGNIVSRTRVPLSGRRLRPWLRAAAFDRQFDQDEEHSDASELDRSVGSADSTTSSEGESKYMMNLVQLVNTGGFSLEDANNARLPEQLRGDSVNTRVRLEKLDECHKPSLLDSFRLSVERKVGEQLDWSPFPPIDCRSTSAETRLVWEYGGKRMTIYLGPNQLDPASAEAGSLPTANVPPTSSQDASKFALGLAKFWTVFRNRASLVIQNWKRDDASTPTNTATKSSVELKNGDGKESHFCVDEHRKSVRSTNMHTVSSIDSFENDRQLYLVLRKTLNAGKGSWLRRLSSWKTCTALQLCKFTILFDNHDLVHVSGQKLNASAHDVLCGNYEYPNLLGSDLDNLMLVMAETILQGLKNPDLGLKERFVLDGLPKLKSPPGIARERGKSGCGFHAIQGYSLMKVLFWIGVMLSPGLAFIAVWLSVVGALDLQNAFVPITFLSGLIAIILGISMMLGV